MWQLVNKVGRYSVFSEGKYRILADESGAVNHFYHIDRKKDQKLQRKLWRWK